MAFLRRIDRILLPLVLTLLASLAHADETNLAERFRVSGFGTLGLTKGGNDYLGFRSGLDQEGVFDGDWSFLAESSLGLQVDFNSAEECGGTIQLLAKDTVADDLEESVSWAFLRYRFHPDWTLRVGRIGIDQYMLSDYRNVGFAYLWSRPPVEFYTPLSFRSLDGMSLDWSTPLGSGMLTTKLQAGNSSNTFSTFGNQVELNLKPVIVFNLHWEADRWQARVSVSRLTLEPEDGYFPGSVPIAENLQSPFLAPFWPQAASYADGFRVEDPDLYYYSTGFAYDSAPWRVQFEASYGESDTDFYPALMSGYLSVGYQIGPVTPFVMYSIAYTPEDRFEMVPPAAIGNPAIDVPLALLSQGLQDGRDLARIDQHTLSLGARWDIRYDIALKAQWDHSWVSAYSGGLWDQKAVPSEDEELNTLSINLNFIF